MILPQQPVSTAQVEAPAEPKPTRHKAAIRRETREILASQYGRVRALTSYGMTREQVAELYGVTVDEIERICRRGTTSGRASA
jgi:DNA invertase Pin-like site-specific DNA recombinase